MNVAIVGSNGFIARHLINKLAQNEAYKLFLFGRAEKGEWNLPYTRIDIANPDTYKSAFSNIDVVYYMVSETIPSTSWDNPHLEIESNLKPFLCFMEAISHFKIKKVAFISSGGTVYGPALTKAAEESDKKPFSPYGIIKLTMEYFLNYYHVKYGINFDVYRVSNVYGEGQNTGKGLGIINIFLEKIINNGKIEIFGDGRAIRNFIYVKDVANLLLLSVLKPDKSGVYNVSSNATLSVIELVEVIRKVVTERFEMNCVSGRKSDNSFIDLDNKKILKNFDEFTFTSLEEGIRQTYSFLKETKVNDN